MKPETRTIFRELLITLIVAILVVLGLYSCGVR
jgi:hypothetical protein